MDLYQWLLDNIFMSIDVSRYEDYIVLTLCVLTILFISLVAKALCGVFNIFFK